MKTIKKWWFYILVPVLVIAAVFIAGGKKELKNYEDYIFYGIAQNKVIGKERLRVNYIVKGFPYRRHSVYVEIVRPDGTLDFLYSEEHTREHKAHYKPNGGLRKYKASYVIPKLPKGKYKLRVTFEFDTPGWGRLNRDKLISNDIKFEIK